MRPWHATPDANVSGLGSGRLRLAGDRRAGSEILECRGAQLRSHPVRSGAGSGFKGTAKNQGSGAQLRGHPVRSRPPDAAGEEDGLPLRHPARLFGTGRVPLRREQFQFMYAHMGAHMGITPTRSLPQSDRIAIPIVSPKSMPNKHPHKFRNVGPKIIFSSPRF